MESEKSKLYIRAQKEIELLKKTADKYYSLCADSALKAFGVLCEDGHSGSSIEITEDILVRLIKGLPLTPITEEDFANDKDGLTKDQIKEGIKNFKICTRQYSLFRKEYNDGTVIYSDTNRVVFIAQDGIPSYLGLATNAVNELFPITLPYMPQSKPYHVYGSLKTIIDGEDKTLDPKYTGTYNKVYLDYIITPDGKHVDLNREIDC